MPKTFVIGAGLDGETATHVRKITADLVTIPEVYAGHELLWQKRNLGTESEIGLGAAGCLLAHLKIWEMIAECAPTTGGSFLVLENDAVLTRYGRNWLGRVFHHSVRAELDLVHLGRTKSGSRFFATSSASVAVNAISQSVGFCLPPMLAHGFAWRTHAYLISCAMATYLVERRFDFTAPIDQRLRETFSSTEKTGSFRVVSSLQPLFLQANRQSLVEKRGR